MNTLSPLSSSSSQTLATRNTQEPSFSSSYRSMDPYKAAETVLKHFDAIEGVGMNNKGQGAGDGNIGRSELERVAAPNSGFPAEARAAARWLMDHPTAARSVDQGAGQAAGDANEVHLNKSDLRTFVSNGPSGSTGSTGSTPPSVPSSPSPVGGRTTAGDQLQSMLQNMGLGQRQAAFEGARLDLSLGDVAGYRKNMFEAATGFEPGASPQAADANAFRSSYRSMDPYKAAETVLKHFDAMEGVGMNSQGQGAGDGNIGRSELERVAAPNSGFPAEARAAARWLMDHPTAARSVDQGAGQAAGDANEVHLNKSDLRTFVSNGPARPTEGQPGQATSPRPPDITGGQHGQPACCPSPVTQQADLLSGLASGLAGGGYLSGVPSPRPQLTDVYSAAKVLKDHFQFAEGVGMNDKGQGAGDNNIGLAELQRLAQPGSGAPKEVRDAARFLLQHPTALRSVDQGASKARGDAREVHVSLQDLQAFASKAPNAAV